MRIARVRARFVAVALGLVLGATPAAAQLLSGSPPGYEATDGPLGPDEVDVRLFRLHQLVVPVEVRGTTSRGRCRRLVVAATMAC
jgi:hypothetical protein